MENLSDETRPSPSGESAESACDATRKSRCPLKCLGPATMDVARKVWATARRYPLYAVAGLAVAYACAYCSNCVYFGLTILGALIFWAVDLQNDATPVPATAPVESSDS